MFIRQSFSLLYLVLPTLALTNLHFKIKRSCSLAATLISTRNELVCDIDKALFRNQNPDSLLQRLENLNKLDAPNRSPQHAGLWYVWYTDCPPPSNGKLGPFSGSSQQFISSEGNGYQNLLDVNGWLTATLDGKWEEWDGRLLEESPMDAESDTKESRDWGANHWKVTFIRLQIALFGLPIFTQTFPPKTSRIWRTTFLDDDIRIVRAGRTGRREDESVFYTKRTPPPGGKVASP
ncbi:hypothetical protein FisN_17Hh033 [Fistulifera solaris]|jgi:hypothetical protein|uniref:Plastid lipid-associated protein/fibrillin conserved domain-containing protein n=1 Tax=Fistulifera solaris TaxID=1519565 RepID=A0A1Z5JGH9_FISSO|nr:hypothetical protein FisN_17Hh033 [Fistulifera solaris]|eukprot:GAX13104.1 hypothetical protein FisN_17Hh033 [Fistulifera solaris]